MLSNKACEYLIFILPTCLLFGLTTGFLITMSQDISANLALGLSLGLSIAFGLASIAFAIWFGYVGRLRDFLKESKSSQVDEKISVILGHAMFYQSHFAATTPMEIRNLYLRKVNSDVRAIGRIRESIEPPQREDLGRAKEDLLESMRHSGFNEDANEVDMVFTLWLW